MKKTFIAGLLVWLPIVVTYVVIRFIVDLLDGTLALLPARYQPEQLFGYHIPGLGLIFTLIILLLTGLLVTNFIGHRIVAAWDRLVSRIPLIRAIYSAVKQVLHTVLQPQGNSFRKVLLVEYPRPGIWSIAFQTSNALQQTLQEEEMVIAFVPTTPNPTSGFLLIVPIKDTRELAMTVEEALRMVISLGVVSPELLACKTPTQQSSVSATMSV